jgi:tetraspanin-5
LCFQLLGVTLLGVGLWAIAQKNAAMNLATLGESFINPVLLLLISGTVIFVIGFFGCVGALRENIYVILIVSIRFDILGCGRMLGLLQVKMCMLSNLLLVQHVV